jgi:hypothetical protein
MTTSTREIIDASMNVSQDTSHGGAYSSYRVWRPWGEYEVSVTVRRFHPAPGERSFQPSTTTQVLHKDGREVADFLSRLALVHKVFELEGRDLPFAFLHPYFYGFGQLRDLRPVLPFGRGDDERRQMRPSVSVVMCVLLPLRRFAPS